MDLVRKKYGNGGNLVDNSQDEDDDSGQSASDAHDDDDGGSGPLKHTTDSQELDQEGSSRYFRPDDDDAPEQLAKIETQAVCGLRTLVLSVLVLSMVGISLAVWFVSVNYEQKLFEQQWDKDSRKVMSSIGAHLDRSLGGMDTMAVQLVSLARATGQEWPFVTIPDFAVRASKLQALSSLVVLNVYPYVETRLQRGFWELYTTSRGPEWVNESLELLEREGYLDVLGNLNNNSDGQIPYSNILWQWEWDNATQDYEPVQLPPNQQGPFLPMWQNNPLRNVYKVPPYNWDLMTYQRNSSFLSAIDTLQVTISEARNVDGNSQDDVLVNSQLQPELVPLPSQTAANTHALLNALESEPVSDIYYPILDTAADWIHVPSSTSSEGTTTPTTSPGIISNDPSDTAASVLGGLLAATVYWRDFVQSALPEGSDGIIVVFENPCNPTFSYRINGPSARFLGTGDFHEEKYEYLETSAMLLDLNDFYGKIVGLGGSGVYSGLPVNQDYTCQFRIRLFPSSSYQATFMTENPMLLTISVVGIFVLVTTVFLVYDCLVEHRQRVVMETATRTNEIVTSLFPSNVRDRLFVTQKQPLRSQIGFVTPSMRDGETSTSTGGGGGAAVTTSESLPIADLFPEATVLFADLAGFTGWSSSREPSQVFILLETLYGKFDKIAKRRGVFKVETIGDCYVAVVGLPQPRNYHAMVMAKFAANIRDAMNELTRELELTLGPGTGDLLLRCGLHSGSVTAGVLRGEKSRFQLFGDTVNTAARMESNGKPNHIHCSQKTADLITDAGKSDWLTRRADMIEAKGKGKMQTYWVEPKRNAMSAVSYASDISSQQQQQQQQEGGRDFFLRQGLTSGSTATETLMSAAELAKYGYGAQQPGGSNNNDPLKHGGSSHGSERGGGSGSSGSGITRQRRRVSEFNVGSRRGKRVSIVLPCDTKTDRLVDWIVTVFAELLQKLVAHRKGLGMTMKSQFANNAKKESIEWKQQKQSSNGGMTVLDEMMDTIIFPPFVKPSIEDIDPSTVELPAEVVTQLHNFISVISQSYRSNSFHNFDHAAHVTMSTNKLLRQVSSYTTTSTSSTSERSERRSDKNMDQQQQSASLTAATTDESTLFGILIDPLAQLAIVFGALVHDVDHRGIPNTALVEEDVHLASYYKNRSVAEQNSVDIAWNVFMEPIYGDLRACLFQTQADLQRFRQLVVNSVMATDIMDPQLRIQREQRWNKAFFAPPPEEQQQQQQQESSEPAATELVLHRKATVVLEHTLLASSICHCMQHWTIYQKWNRALFLEFYGAYKDGRPGMQHDPSQTWYDGQVEFFDSTIIPLAKRLKECQVFGVSGSDFLDSAVENRLEWQAKGTDIVQEMVQECGGPLNSSGCTGMLPTPTSLLRMGSFAEEEEEDEDDTAKFTSNLAGIHTIAEALNEVSQEFDMSTTTRSGAFMPENEEGGPPDDSDHDVAQDLRRVEALHSPHGCRSMSSSSAIKNAVHRPVAAAGCIIPPPYNNNNKSFSTLVGSALPQQQQQQRHSLLDSTTSEDDDDDGGGIGKVNGNKQMMMNNIHHGIDIHGNGNNIGRPPNIHGNIPSNPNIHGNIISSKPPSSVSAAAAVANSHKPTTATTSNPPPSHDEAVVVGGKPAAAAVVHAENTTCLAATATESRTASMSTSSSSVSCCPSPPKHRTVGGGGSGEGGADDSPPPPIQTVAAAASSPWVSDSSDQDSSSPPTSQQLDPSRFFL